MYVSDYYFVICANRRGRRNVHLKSKINCTVLEWIHHKHSFNDHIKWTKKDFFYFHPVWYVVCFQNVGDLSVD